MFGHQGGVSAAAALTEAVSKHLHQAFGVGAIGDAEGAIGAGELLLGAAGPTLVAAAAFMLL